MADELIGSGEQLSLVKAECYKVYSRRWVMLAIFTIFGTSNAHAWEQYAPISDSIAAYYNVSMATVDMLCAVVWITYILTALPVIWLTACCGLKPVLIFGASSQCIGSWIRYVGTCTRSITLNFVGQILCSMGQPCCFGMSSQLAGTWFGIDEVSLANGFGFASIEIGTGSSILISRQVVHSDSRGSELEYQMKRLFLSTAITTTVILPLTIFVFEASPPLPPSKSKMNVHVAGQQDSYYHSLLVLFKNRNFVLLLVVYSLAVGFLSVITFKLNDTIQLAISKNSSTLVASIGLTKMIAGTLGPVAVGYWLDQSKRFRSSAIATTLLNVFSMISFTMSLYLQSSLSALLSMSVYWFISACVIITAFEFAVELTYPEPEIMSSGLLSLSGYAFSCVLMPIFDVVLVKANVLVAMVLSCAILLLAFMLTLFIGSDYRRQDADRENYREVQTRFSDYQLDNDNDK